MRKRIHKILVTGGAGFIGSEFVRQTVRLGYGIVLVDKLTYAGDLARLEEVRGRFKFYKVDICNKKRISEIFKKEKPQLVVHFAAESHVDRSIKDSEAFIETNVKGTHVLLEESKKINIKRFIHISTDEVYGDIKRGKFFEGSPLNPSSPYSASKAAADCLVKAYIRTYNFPAIIIRPCNNYGPWQYPEKFIPVAIRKVLNNDRIPIYGKGLNSREWLHVKDCVKATILILKKGKIGEIYNVGSGIEKRNIDLAKAMLKILHKPEYLFKFVKDRLGHDFRYALSISKIKRLGWERRNNLNSQLKDTIAWYKKNVKWINNKLP